MKAGSERRATRRADAWSTEAEIGRLTATRRAQLALDASQLARGAEIDTLAAKLLGDRRRLVFRELAVLPRELDQDEEVLDLAYAHMFIGSGVLVLTNQRLLFVNHRLLLPGVSVKRFALDSLRDHRVMLLQNFGRLTLDFRAQGWRSRRVFDRIRPVERASAIDAKLGELRVTSHSTAAD